MRRLGPFPLGVVVALITTAFGTGLPSTPARAGSTTVLVPAYFYPSGAGRTAWDQLADGARSVRLEAILNPGSGPGTRSDPNYVAAVDRVRQAGGRVLGYVDTAYGQRGSQLVERDILSYLTFYQVDGFFLDQMANTPQAVGYYEGIYRFIKERNPGFKVVANPGTPYTLPAYLNAADTLVIFEGPGASYANYKPSVPAAWVADHPPGRFANIVYGIADASDMERTLKEAQRTNAGTVFITDGSLPNPYLRLPGYWTQELAAIAAIDSPQSNQTAPATIVPPAPSPPPTASSSPAWPSPQADAGPSMVVPAPAAVLIWPCLCEVRPIRRQFLPGRAFRHWAAGPGCLGAAGH